jgi:hypothetical protein
LKQVFEGRAIIEVQSADAVAAMRELEQMSEVEKTSLFGTAVHAVLRDARMTPDQVAGKLRAKGVSEARAEAVEPSLEDVFLDVVERSAR